LKYIVLSLCCLAVFGCETKVTSQAPLNLGLDLDLPVPSNRLVMPKAETSDERQSTKTDEFDVRGEYAEIFGESQPPPRQVRALAEFENTEAVLIAWEPELDGFLLNLIESTSQASDVWVLTWDLETSDSLRTRLEGRGVNLASIRFFEFPHESFWTRDFGPISVVDEEGQTTFIDPKYYPQRRRDDAVPTLMARYFNVDVARPNLATEGGNFMTNGAGICVVTEWLLQENPNIDGNRIQRIQDQYFGCRQTIVLERLEREGTGHVDMFAKFVSQNTILVGQYDELDPQNAALLDRNVERLEDFARENSWSLNIVRIPMPSGSNGVYRSYTNSLIVNDRVIVPIYRADRRYEAEALEIYENAMPAGYTVVTVDAEDAIQLGGAVHCTTMGFVTAAFDVTAPEPTTVPRFERPNAGETDNEPIRSEPNLIIADLETTVDTISIRETGLAFSIEVELELEHSYLGDLVISLEHEGFETTLLRNLGTGQRVLKRSFEMSVPRGVERSGIWRLVVRDTAAQDTGVLKAWSIRFEN
jgi:agmatine/peptidylarginine deiminase